MQAYSDPSRESDPHALPDIEVWSGYRHECPACQHEQPLVPDYYGLLYQDQEKCEECEHVGLRVLDTKVAWYWWSCLPGCLPDGEANGPFDTQADALADAQYGAGE